MLFDSDLSFGKGSADLEAKLGGRLRAATEKAPDVYNTGA